LEAVVGSQSWQLGLVQLLGSPQPIEYPQTEQLATVVDGRPGCRQVLQLNPQAAPLVVEQEEQVRAVARAVTESPGRAVSTTRESVSYWVQVVALFGSVSLSVFPV
jgi:hypothetical protein